MTGSCREKRRAYSCCVCTTRGPFPTLMSRFVRFSTPYHCRGKCDIAHILSQDVDTCPERWEILVLLVPYAAIATRRQLNVVWCHTTKSLGIVCTQNHFHHVFPPRPTANGTLLTVCIVTLFSVRYVNWFNQLLNSTCTDNTALHGTDRTVDRRVFNEECTLGRTSRSAVGTCYTENA